MKSDSASIKNAAPTAGQVARQAPYGSYCSQSDVQRLEAWFRGDVALTRQEAHRLLDHALAAGYLWGRKAEHVAAIKALAAGPSNWSNMGYRILPDA